MTLCFIFERNSVLTCSYLLQCNRKCVSVSTCLCGQSWHNLSSLGSQVCLCQPTSTSSFSSRAFYFFVDPDTIFCDPPVGHDPESGSDCPRLFTLMVFRPTSCWHHLRKLIRLGSAPSGDTKVSSKNSSFPTPIDRLCCAKSVKCPFKAVPIREKKMTKSRSARRRGV